MLKKYTIVIYESEVLWSDFVYPKNATYIKHTVENNRIENTTTCQI